MIFRRPQRSGLPADGLRVDSAHATAPPSPPTTAMLRVENTHIIASLTTSTPTKRKPRQATLPSSVVLIRVLPGLASLAREGAKQAKRSKHSHILSESLATAFETPLDARAAAPAPKLRHAEATKDERRRANSSTGANADGSYEAFQVLRAIEKHDIMLLMDVKTRQFELLTTAVGGTTPLVHAMRLGKSRESPRSARMYFLLTNVSTDRDIAILLTGAISRRVRPLMLSRDSSTCEADFGPTR